MPSFTSTFVATLAALSGVVNAQIGGQCPPLDTQQPNPIANQFTTQTTGTANGTQLIIPIPLSQARAYIPKQYPILTKQIKQWLPKLGAKNYPLLFTIEKLHDIYHDGTAAGSGADYLRAYVSFPFVDRLKDGYTAMRYIDTIIVSSTASSAISALGSQGYDVSGGYFANCNPYEYQNGTFGEPPAKRTIDQAAWITSNTNLGNPNIALRANPVASNPYSINYLYNVTNQPIFAGTNSECNSFVRLYNTDVSESPFAPVRVFGNATALKGFFNPSVQTIWNGVYGYKLDVAYHAGGLVSCQSLQGFHVNTA